MQNAPAARALKVVGKIHRGIKTGDNHNFEREQMKIEEIIPPTSKTKILDKEG